MNKHNLIFSLILATGILSPVASQAQPAVENSDASALGTSPRWLTTKVYIEGAPEIDVKDKYPGVVGISAWDPDRNRYEFFYTDTGLSKYDNGGGGYFMVTGDKKNHILIPDKGVTRTVVRKLETLNNQEFTYSREVPRDMIDSNPLVRIHVVHAPYTGSVKTTPTH